MPQRHSQGGVFYYVGAGVGSRQGQEDANLVQSFVGPLEQWPDRQIDRRLVRTFFLALVAIVRLRHSRSGLLLSELGGHVLSPAQAPAGTKRLSNLLRSSKWSHTLLEEFVWRREDQQLAQMGEGGELALAIWDESVLEKPENIALEGLCPVRSSKAARLKRIKPSYYNPPAGPPVFGPGLQWLTVMVAGMQGLWPWPPCVGGPAGANCPATVGNRPHPCYTVVPSGGKVGWCTSSTGDLPAPPGLRNWQNIKRGSSYAGPPATTWPTAGVSVPPGKSLGANALRTTGRSGTCADASTARPASWRFQSATPA